METPTASDTQRQALIEALKYPRTLINAGLELERCPHNGMYTDTDPRCIACENGPECEWLFHNGEFAALTEKPVHDLVGALEYALLHVSAFASTAGHDVQNCRCANCQWVRDSQSLLESSGHGT